MAENEALLMIRSEYDKAIASAVRNELKALVAEFKKTFTKNLRQTVIVGAVSAAVGWVLYAALLAVHYDGYEVIPGSAAPGKGNAIEGGVFAFLTAGLVSIILGFRQAKGKQGLSAQVRSIPARVRTVLDADGKRTVPDALWGVAGGLAASSLLARLSTHLGALGRAVGSFSTHAVSGILALYVVLLVGTALRRTASGMLMVGWQKLAVRLAPAHKPLLPATFEVVLVGVGVSFAISWLVSSTSTRFGIAALAAGAAYILRRSGPPSPGVTAAVVVLAVGLFVAGHGVTPAFADDGGYKECGSRGLTFWLTNCGGSAKVLKWALLGGLFTFGGTLFGFPVGTMLPGLVDEFTHKGPLDDKDQDPLCLGGCDGAQTSSAPRDAWNQFRKRNPDAPLDDSWLITRLYHQTRQDVLSGDMATRMNSMASNTPDAIAQMLMNKGMPMAKSMIDTKAYFDNGNASEDWKHFWNRPTNEVNHDLVGMLDSFRTNTDPVSNSVLSSIQSTIDDFDAFKGKYLDALARNDQVELGKLHAQGNAEFGFQVMTTIGPEVAARGGLGLPARTIRLETTAGAAVVGRSRAEIEALLDTAMKDTAVGDVATVKLTPEEAERFNVSKHTALNMWETNLQNGTFQQFKIGPEYGPNARAAGKHFPKPNSMGAKSLTPEEAAALGLPPERAGDVYDYVPESLPDPTSSAYKKMLFRQQNADALQAEMDVLSTKGGKGIDSMGQEYHYTTRKAPDGRVLIDTYDGVKVEGDVPFRIDEDTSHWGSNSGKTIRITDPDTGRVTDLVIPGRDVPDSVHQRWIYQQSDGAVAGEGRTRMWEINPDDPKYVGHPEKYDLDIEKRATTLAALDEEGWVTIDADGIKICKKRTK